MGLDIWLGWPGKPAPQERDESSGDGSVDTVDSLRFTYDRSRFSPLSQTFELWAQTQLGGRGIYWILDLDDTKRVPVDERGDGRIVTGIRPEWERCEKRVTEALNLAKAIPDRLFVVRTSQLRKPLDDYPTTTEILQYYRAEREKRKDRGKVSCMPPYFVLEDFQTTAGVFFGDEVPKIKAAVLCRGALGMELVFVCQGHEEIHQGYIPTLEAIQKFVALGAAHQAWVCWSG